MQSTRATPPPTAPEMDWSTPLLVANAPADEPGSPEFPLDDADPASNATTVLSSEPTRRAAAAAICERITESLARGRSLAAVSELFRIGAAEFSELPDGRLPDIVSAATFNPFVVTTVRSASRQTVSGSAATARPATATIQIPRSAFFISISLCEPPRPPRWKLNT